MYYVLALAVIHRKYCMPYIPSAFWSHFIARMILFAQDIIQIVMSGADSVSQVLTIEFTN